MLNLSIGQEHDAVHVSLFFLGAGLKEAEVAEKALLWLHRVVLRNGAQKAPLHVGASARVKFGDLLLQLGQVDAAHQAQRLDNICNLTSYTEAGLGENAMQ